MSAGRAHFPCLKSRKDIWSGILEAMDFLVAGTTHANESFRMRLHLQLTFSMSFKLNVHFFPGRSYFICNERSHNQMDRYLFSCIVTVFVCLFIAYSVTLLTSLIT
jgi:hypothetical protein